MVFIDGKYYGLNPVEKFKLIVKKHYSTKKTIAIQDSWGSWFFYCKKCDQVFIELDPHCEFKECPKCKAKTELSIPA